MRRWLQDNSFIFTLVGLSLICAALASAAKADVKGIPFSDRFQSASYPYARQVAGCTDWRRPDRLGDAWGDVSFAGACQQHDRCYHTQGSSWGECNQLFLNDLRAACDRDLERARLEKGHKGKPDAQAQQLCYEIANLYYAKAQQAEAVRRFDFDQKQENDYLGYVRTVIDDVYKAVLHRNATEKEKTRALVALTKDYSLDDLKAALMGAKLDQAAPLAGEPLPQIDSTDKADVPDVTTAVLTTVEAE